mmetsp:Transcript_18468/g.33445  ORF Transcript_18468/g.33445 Transcript_18468/m.33445 type:complete len:226 (-) Transcript_18468:29-706(-)
MTSVKTLPCSPTACLIAKLTFTTIAGPISSIESQRSLNALIRAVYGWARRSWSNFPVMKCPPFDFTSPLNCSTSDVLPVPEWPETKTTSGLSSELGGLLAIRLYASTMTSCSLSRPYNFPGKNLRLLLISSSLRSNTNISGRSTICSRSSSVSFKEVYAASETCNRSAIRFIIESGAFRSESFRNRSLKTFPNAKISPRISSLSPPLFAALFFISFAWAKSIILT